MQRHTTSLLSLRLWILGSYAILAAIPLLPSLGDNVFAQTTALMRFDPWRTSLEPPETDFFVYPFPTDVMSAYLPWERHIRRMDFGWNPYQTAGAPFMAAHFTAVYYPPKLALAWLGQPETRSVAILTWLHLVFAAWGVFELALRLGLKRFPAWMAGVWFAGAAFSFIWIGGPLPLLTAWMPWLFLAIESILSAPWQTKRNTAAWGFSGIVFITLMIWLAGNSQTGIHVFLAAFLYGIVRCWVLHPEFPLKRLLLIFTAGCLGTMAAGMQLLPAAHAILHSSAWHGRGPLHAESILFAWPETKLFTALILLAPGIIGTPFEPLHQIILQFYPEIHSLALFHEMAGGSIGLFGAVLAFASFFLLKDKTCRLWCWPWIVVGIFFFFAVYDLPPVFNILTAAPVVGKLNHHRSCVVLAFAMSMLAAYGLNRILESSQDQAGISSQTDFIRKAILIAATILGFILMAAAGVVGRLQPLSEARTSQASLLLAFLGLGLLIALLLAALHLKQLRNVVLGLVAIISVVQLAWLGRWYVQPSPPQWCYPENETITWLREHSGETRILFSDDIMPPSLCTWYGLREMSGYEPTGNRYVDDLILLYAQKDHWLKPYLMYLPYRESPFLDLFAIRYVVTRQLDDSPATSAAHAVEVLRPRPWLRILERQEIAQRVRCYENVDLFETRQDVLAYLKKETFNIKDSVVLDRETGIPVNQDFVKGKAQIVEDGIGSVAVDVESPGPALLVLFDGWFPGWSVSVDEESAPLLRAFGGFRAVEVPGGAHRIQFTFTPVGLRLGWGLSICTLPLWLAAVWWLSRRPKHTPPL